MEKDKDILKWFENGLSDAKIKDLNTAEDFTTLQKIAHYSKQLQAPKVDAQKALDSFRKRDLSKKDTKVRTLTFKTFFRVAAVLTILLTSSYFLVFNNTASYTTQFAEMETLVLPDNSEVVLNSNSKLNYNKKSWDNKRLLELDGEAFFKVTKGEKFTVKTDAGSIQVLGTQFNVKERGNYFEVTCYEGKVSVTNNNNEHTILTQGQSIRVLNGIAEKFTEVNIKAPSWLAFESTFKHVPLIYVIEELENVYGIKIKTKNVNTQQLFSGSFTHNDKNTALQTVTIPLKLSFKTNGETVEFYNYEQ